MKIQLKDVSETTLWTLHNRAVEAARSDGIIQDPNCLTIYQTIDYDYQRSFGKADGSHAVRSFLFDQQIKTFLQQHPDGVIINLGEGLETQRFRIEAPQALWVTVDLPESIQLREQFIQPDSQHWHIAQSALDTGWFDAIPPNRALFITAQGLLMYFTQTEVEELLKAMAQRFPGAIFMFDFLNKMLSKRSLSAGGWMKTPHYRTPAMPWGIDRDELPALLQRCFGAAVTVHHLSFLFPRGLLRYLIPFCEKIPFIRNIMPGICYVKFPDNLAADSITKPD